MKDFKSTRTISAYKDAVPEKHTILFKVEHLSQEHIEEYAMRGIVIQAQAAYRAWLKTDRSKVNPILDSTYNTPIPGTKTADPVKTLAKAGAAINNALKATGMTLEQLADYLAALDKKSVEEEEED